MYSNTSLRDLIPPVRSRMLLLYKIMLTCVDLPSSVTRRGICEQLSRCRRRTRVSPSLPHVTRRCAAQPGEEGQEDAGPYPECEPLRRLVPTEISSRSAILQLRARTRISQATMILAYTKDTTNRQSDIRVYDFKEGRWLTNFYSAQE